jgi:oligosaccharyltransferase complex subunit alpha (ribophorin I)
LAFTAAEGAEKTEEAIKYGPYENVEPLSFEKVKIFFVFMDPLIVLEEASKRIEISHWGNIGVHEHFYAKNVGAKVKGEWSRRDFESRQFGRACLTELHAEYPWYIRDMYVDDFIGNISSTHALKS